MAKQYQFIDGSTERARPKKIVPVPDEIKNRIHDKVRQCILLAIRTYDEEIDTPRIDYALTDYDWMDDRDSYPEYDDIDFADPGGRSALRAATIDNPRNLSCPTCGEPNRLTPADRERGYQCDECADRVERGGY